MRKIVKRVVCAVLGHSNAQFILFFNDQVRVRTTVKCTRCSLISTSWTYSRGSSGYERLTELRQKFFEGE